MSTLNGDGQRIYRPEFGASNSCQSLNRHPLRGSCDVPSPLARRNLRPRLLARSQ
jgi:hypothetical protein